MGLRIGVIGTGKLGKEHVRVLKRIPEVEHVACFDIETTRSRSVAAEHGAEAFDTVEKLMNAVDAVSVVVPTSHHASVSLEALDRGKNLFLEKPIAASIGEAEKIISAAKKFGRILQIGHIERFNPVVREAAEHVDRPSFIEIHRLAPFNVRGIDVSVIMDLMIHDLDLLSMFTGCEPTEIRAKGATILTNGPDIVNARIEYGGGCVANLTASRVSLEPLRKVRVFSNSGYVSIDLLKRTFRHVKKSKRFDSRVEMLRKEADLHDFQTSGKISLDDFIEVYEAESKGEEPLFGELQAFCRTITTKNRPVVTGEDGLRALRLASEIQALVEKSES